MSLPIYRTISNLSIDVALGAVITSAFLASVLNVHVDSITYIVLGCVVWSIYTFDHLLDAKKVKGNISLMRYEFHRNHFNMLSIALALSLMVTSILIFYLPGKILLLGTVLGLMVIVYFITVHLSPGRKVYHKEITAALVYFSGTLIGPLGSFEEAIEIKHIQLLICYFILIILNLVIFSNFDKAADESNDFPSIYRVIDNKKVRYGIVSLSLIFLFLLTNVYFNFGGFTAILLLLMFAVLEAIYLFANHPTMVKYYRVLGDGIFLLPVLYFL
ncbi:MAG: hypothetical protein RLO81_09330 [Fulvivirga sp.]|uniref:hypothetical protein n=1 Tax=Fulvivirga sp. TaxID=1931237 RepID=UPI0032EC0882